MEDEDTDEATTDAAEAVDMDAEDAEMEDAETIKATTKETKDISSSSSMEMKKIMEVFMAM
jgi:hypothetical protein